MGIALTSCKKTSSAPAPVQHYDTGVSEYYLPNPGGNTHNYFAHITVKPNSNFKANGTIIACVLDSNGTIVYNQNVQYGRSAELYFELSKKQVMDIQFIDTRTDSNFVFYALQPNNSNMIPLGSDTVYSNNSIKHFIINY